MIQTDFVDKINLVLESRITDDLGQWSALLTQLIDNFERIGCQFLSLSRVGKHGFWGLRGTTLMVSDALGYLHFVGKARVGDFVGKWPSTFQKLVYNLERLLSQKLLLCLLHGGCWLHQFIFLLLYAFSLKLGSFLDCFGYLQLESETLIS